MYSNTKIRQRNFKAMSNPVPSYMLGRRGQLHATVLVMTSWAFPAFLEIVSVVIFTMREGGREEGMALGLIEWKSSHYNYLIYNFCKFSAIKFGLIFLVSLFFIISFYFTFFVDHVFLQRNHNWSALMDLCDFFFICLCVAELCVLKVSFANFI